MIQFVIVMLVTESGRLPAGLLEIDEHSHTIHSEKRPTFRQRFDRCPGSPHDH